MILVYLRTRTLARAELLRAAPPSPVRLVRVWDSQREREKLLTDPDVVGVWGPYDLLSVPTEVDALTPDKVITADSPPPAAPPPAAPATVGVPAPRRR